MMRRILLSAFMAVTTLSIAEAKTLRVNNAPGSGAQYTNFEDAQKDAEDGDVIIFDGSSTSYGDITVSKKLTIQGPGYFLGTNNTTSEGIETATFGNVNVRAAGAKIRGIVVPNWGSHINLRADEIEVSGCYVTAISLCANFSYTDQCINNCIIRHNYIMGSIAGDSYSAPANYILVTNNIFKSISGIANMNKSTISRNTIIYGYDVSYRQLSDCIFEYNIGPIPGDYWENKNNTVRENLETNHKPYQNTQNDSAVREIDSSLMAEPGVFTHGAFSGNDPYVLSGLVSGPRIQDIEMPESVVQGENMEVSVKIAVTQ